MQWLGCSTHGLPPGGEEGRVLWRLHDRRDRSRWWDRPLHSSREPSAPWIMVRVIVAAVAETTAPISSICNMVEAREFVRRRTPRTLTRVRVDVHAPHRMVKSRNVNILGEVMQELAVLAFRTCTAEPEAT